ncbi:MAG: hypothetical protein HYS19_07820 [Nitrosomonadales bacterium]|nr:hypothetical protein [Nitrosomonadales bacterium]
MTGNRRPAATTKTITPKKVHQSYSSVLLCKGNNTRRTIMAKGQQRKTKEAKKPKKQPPPAAVSGAFEIRH